MAKYNQEDDNKIDSIIISDLDDEEDKETMRIAEKINKYANEFINNNQHLDVRNVKHFTLMCKYIGNKTKGADKDNIKELNTFWDCFTIMCYTCGVNPSLERYCMMAKVDQTTLITWKTGEYRGGPSSPHSQSVKRWMKECESSLRDVVETSGNIGCMFVLKTNYGYRENVNISVDNTAQLQQAQLTTEQIAEQYGQQIIEQKPPEIDF